MPLGLSISLASFASSLFGATPIEQLRPVATADGLLDAARERQAALHRAAVNGVEIDVHLVDAAILDARVQSRRSPP